MLFVGPPFLMGMSEYILYLIIHYVKKKKMIASAGVILVTCSARFRKFVLKKPRLILIYIYRLKTKMEK